MSVNSGSSFAHSLRKFAETLTQNFSLQIAAQPEDQLKGPVQDLMKAAGLALSREVGARTETHAEDVHGRPDIGIAVEKLLTGHIELKAPGKGARPERYTGADLKQWEKFKNLPNLLYTDGSEWALYRTGKRAGQVVRFSGDVTRDGKHTCTDEDAAQLLRILTDFLSWVPIVPTSPIKLAELLAPLCRLLRSDVLIALEQPSSNLSQLAQDWRNVLFPNADDAQFADAYAQTLTYALLLARFRGQRDVRTSLAADALEKGHGLLAQALRVLADPEARKEINLGVELLERTITAIDTEPFQTSGNLWADTRKKNRDLWLYFYEYFLAAYDPKLRNDRGVYYTPVEVIHAQSRLVSQLLIEQFDKRLSFADQQVILLDPAVGTGAYPLAAMQLGLDYVEKQFGAGAIGGYASAMAAQMHAFEILVGPYAVAHLRLTQQVLDAGGALPKDGVHVYLTDTLESPYANPKGVTLPLMHKRLAEEHKKAQKVKEEVRVLVCLGNPPYDRQQIEEGDQVTERKGGWVRFGDDHKGGILEDFLAPVREEGKGEHLKNVYNDYVYFWRWALWKVFETTEGAGILSFITAASYLRGPGFVGMRKMMREIFDELWIIDLEGSSLGARKTQNVFAIRPAVAIAIGVRYGEPHSDISAKVRYTKVVGGRAEKLERLAQINKFSDFEWRDCYSEPMSPFLPEGTGNYFSWPSIKDIFPWQHSGAQAKRTWPIGETAEVLHKRWYHLLNLPPEKQKLAFKETRDRKIDKTYLALDGTQRLQAISDLEADEACIEPVKYAFRSFDRQWIIPDSRLGDFLKPVLWRIQSNDQVFMTSILTDVLGVGPAAVVTSLVPDLHHFSGRGAKDVIPLWRSSEADEPNLTNGLIEVLESMYKFEVSPKDIFAYCYALLSSLAYAERFSDELEEPGQRIPLTKNAELFRETVALGEHLIWVHTYGERYIPRGKKKGDIPRGKARYTRPISGEPDQYPQEYLYDSNSQTLHVGNGEFAPVTQEVWDFNVSGLQIVDSWLAYRMKKRRGKKSSSLDEIRPARWTNDLSRELQELLWVLEETVKMFPRLEANLNEVIDSELFTEGELPKPSEEEKEAPIHEGGGEDTAQGELYEGE